MDEPAGLDAINPSLLREARKATVDALSDIFISPVITGEVQEFWRIASVVSLFKKSNRDKPGIHRLVSTVGKLLQKIHGDRIYLQLEKHGVIKDRQLGRSCLANLIEFLEETRPNADPLVPYP